MKSFQYFQPTEIRFGPGRVMDAGAVVRRFGSRCLVVSDKNEGSLVRTYDKVKQVLGDAGIDVAHFDGVRPNPTTDQSMAGAEMARSHRADVVLGVGGGSSMDLAKAIAVEATHKGTAWDYLFYRDTQPTEKTLPIITLSTTSGTGSHVTQVAVITNTANRDKSALYHPILYPRVSIIDPELMVTVPAHLTAATGFDVFTHSFESTLHPGSSPYTAILAKEAIRLVAKYLPTVVRNGRNLEARSAMAWADTMAGLCIANAGVTLPHGMAMAIGGMYPKVMHGEALAIVYPSTMRFSYSRALQPFADMGRIFDPKLQGVNARQAAAKSCLAVDRFLKKIGMWLSLEDFDVPEDELPALARQSMVLPDYKSDPRVATYNELLRLCTESMRR